MKNTIIITIIISFIISIGCSVPSGSKSGGSTNSSGGNTSSSGTAIPINQSEKIYDAGNVLLGYCVSAGEYGVTIYTSKNYLIDLDWAGNIDKTVIFYTGTNAAGTAFANWERGQKIWGKSAFKDGNNNLYKYKTLSGSYAASNASITTYQSYRSSDNTITNTTYTTNNECYEITSATVSEIGLPTVINGPLYFKFE